VNLGTDHDTSAFAIESIRCWWNVVGKPTYPNAKSLYINCDGGGSNGWRTRLWKYELALFAQETGIEVHVSHYPPGTSKWNTVYFAALRKAGQENRSWTLMLLSI